MTAKNDHEVGYIVEVILSEEISEDTQDAIKIARQELFVSIDQCVPDPRAASMLKELVLNHDSFLWQRLRVAAIRPCPFVLALASSRHKKCDNPNPSEILMRVGTLVFYCQLLRERLLKSTTLSQRDYIREAEQLEDAAQEMISLGFELRMRGQHLTQPKLPFKKTGS